MVSPYIYVGCTGSIGANHTPRHNNFRDERGVACGLTTRKGSGADDSTHEWQRLLQFRGAPDGNLLPERPASRPYSKARNRTQNNGGERVAHRRHLNRWLPDVSSDSIGTVNHRPHTISSNTLSGLQHGLFDEVPQRICLDKSDCCPLCVVALRLPRFSVVRAHVHF